MIGLDINTARGFYLVENWVDDGGRTKCDPCCGSWALWVKTFAYSFPRRLSALIGQGTI